jgi:hypothetical protein
VFAHRYPVSFAAYSPDGTTFLTVSNDKLRLWKSPVLLEGDAERLRLWVEVNTGQELDVSGAVVPLREQARQERWQRLQRLGGPPR